jgi:hypothetical protein
MEPSDYDEIPLFKILYFLLDYYRGGNSGECTTDQKMVAM